MMTRTGKQDVSETDVSSKKMNIQKKPHRYLTRAGQDHQKLCMRVAVMPCVDFAEASGGGIAVMHSKMPRGLASLQDSRRNRVGRNEDLPTDATQPRRIKASLFHIEHHWQGTLFGVGTIAAIPSVNK